LLPATQILNLTRGIGDDKVLEMKELEDPGAETSKMSGTNARQARSERASLRRNNDPSTQEKAEYRSPTFREMVREESSESGGDCSSSEDEDLMPGAYGLSGSGNVERQAKGRLTVAPEMRTNNDVPSGQESTPAPDPEVPTADVTPADISSSETKGKRRIWVYLGVILLVIGAAVGVAVGVTAGGDDGSSGSPQQILEDSPSPSPTIIVPECPGFESTIDPDIDALDEIARGRYQDFVDSLVPQFFPDYSTPRSAEEYCSAPHLALIWLANDDLQALYSKEEMEIRFLLAFLFVEWKGNFWKNRTGWLNETSVCLWAGVSCDESGDIAELNLSGKLSFAHDPYYIPTEIGFLTDLRTYMIC
jgi:hypothetical protein